MTTIYLIGIPGFLLLSLACLVDDLADDWPFLLVAVPIAAFCWPALLIALIVNVVYCRDVR